MSYQRGVYSRCRTGTPDFWKILKMSPWSLQKRRRTLQLFVRDSSYMFETQPDHQIELHTSNQPQSNSFTPLHFRKTSTSTNSLIFLLNTFFPKKNKHTKTPRKPRISCPTIPMNWGSPFLSLRWLGNPLGISAPSKERKACSKARMSRKTDSAKTSPPSQTAKQGGFTVVECFGCVHFDTGNAVKMTKICIYVIYIDLCI